MQNVFATLVSLVAVAQDRLREEKGATAVEYGLMVGLIAAVIVGLVATLGTELRGMFQDVLDAIGD
ncbi:pilus assembly protein Flp/PilA [Geodermatophilus telluris]|uniref:Pilus assembly protein Flp/PilA n=1 Tax=Geodermatophilus telluris TaxID=1190417 RepID=A0A1G6SGW2_9ACTN|nr:Flp family type IVb pilin [Geodermatophilus telluris]SDD16170.1 pilus assembly protein Flp/PilA [Geodermatophilus telluris]